MNFLQRTRNNKDHKDHGGSSSLFSSPLNNKVLLLTVAALMGLFFISINIDSKLSKALTTNNSKSKSGPTFVSNPNDIPDLLPTDIIYKNARTVFVIPEYKLIFFAFPKVACSEWKRMFMRINGNENWCVIRGFDAHDPLKNGILTLADYPTEIASAMMTSPAWTRAAIVREPKERVLSAFLDKAIKEDYFVRKCCRKIPNRKKRDKALCEKNHKKFGSFLKFVKKYPEECFDVHWEPQVLKVDAKWWPYIDFVGHQENLREDAKTLLSNLYRADEAEDEHGSPQSAWDRYGKTGWGNDNNLCEKRPYEFLEENSSAHNLNAGSQMLEWYTPELEKVVEKEWAVEWEQKEAQFKKIKLFPDRK